MDKKELTSLPNIGKVLSVRLKQVNINTIDDLITIGSENAFIRLLTVDQTTCLNELFALEGAIQNIRWHNLDESKKNDLRIIYKTYKSQIKK